MSEPRLKVLYKLAHGQVQWGKGKIPSMWRYLLLHKNGIEQATFLAGNPAFRLHQAEKYNTAADFLSAAVPDGIPTGKHDIVIVDQNSAWPYTYDKLSEERKGIMLDALKEEVVQQTEARARRDQVSFLSSSFYVLVGAIILFTMIIALIAVSKIHGS